jgi:choline monooxygenase
MDLSDYRPETDLSLAQTIPARWYLDPAILEAEKKRIFFRTWQPVGRIDSLLRPGDFSTAGILGEPLVMARGIDGRLRAFSNVCRHRAGPVASGRGNRKSLQCRYHGWTYGLDGKLLTQPEFEGVRNWDKSTVCLPEYAVQEWGPFAFVNLDSSPVSLSTILDRIPQEVREHEFHVDRMHFVERRDYLVNCNWKVYIDNYLEGYHIPMAHPGLFRELDYDQYRVEPFRYYASAHAPIREIRENDSHARDRRYERAGAQSRALYYWVFPNWMINIYPDNLSINIVLPAGVDKTLTIFEWYFEQPGTGEGWESMQQTIGFSDQIQREDIALCESVQIGLQSKHYNQGRFSVKRENGVHHFHLLLHEFLNT